MDLNLFNSLSRSKEKFTPIKDNHVGLYTCGPTVYNYPHIGNYRAYIFTDMLKRYLTYKGYNVNHIMNITDVDDKTIRDSRAQGKVLKDFTEFYTKGFFEDRDALNIIPAVKYTKATDYISEMVVMVEKLIAEGFAYKSDDGSVYFSIAKDEKYGQLINIDRKIIIDSECALHNPEKQFTRINSDEYDKDSIQDFALWKAWTKEDGDVFWETTLGKGRPGWHIECSAMSIAQLGEYIDIHTGGVDLMFPHHENEIAQSECATGHQFVKYWMHNEHLMVDGKKMSKSLGNFYTLRDLIDKGVSPLAFRLWLYTAHYRTKTNFTIDAVNASGVALERLYDAFLSLGNESGKVNEEYRNKMIALMDDDLDTPKALALMFDLVRDPEVLNKDKRATMLDFDQIFGFGLADLKEDIIPDEIKAIAIEREQTRFAKDWAKSDELRDKITSLGYEIKDVDGGYKISKN